MKPRYARAIWSSLLLAMSSTPALAQVPVEFRPGSSVVSREDLVDLLAQYEEAIGSPAYSERVKASARTSAELIRERLSRGDFRVGDRVVLSVQGEPGLPDTVTVEPGPQITLPLFGSIPLDGVLRSEITEHLTAELGKVIRDPVVRAQGLMRLSVQGAVGRPGFYVVPTDMLLSDALMLAGGPRADADLASLEIERGSRRLLGGEAAASALNEGLTLDQLNLQAGDQLRLDARSTGNMVGVIARFGLALASVLLLGTRVF